MSTIKIESHDTFCTTTTIIIATLDRIKDSHQRNLTKMTDMTKAKYLKDPNL